MACQGCNSYWMRFSTQDHSIYEHLLLDALYRLLLTRFERVLDMHTSPCHLSDDSGSVHSSIGIASSVQQRRRGLLQASHFARSSSLGANARERAVVVAANNKNSSLGRESGFQSTTSLNSLQTITTATACAAANNNNNFTRGRPSPCGSMASLASAFHNQTIAIPSPMLSNRRAATAGSRSSLANSGSLMQPLPQQRTIDPRGMSANVLLKQYYTDVLHPRRTYKGTQWRRVQNVCKLWKDL